MESLENNIKNSDNCNILNDISDLINAGCKKNEIVSFLINLYCNNYINKNLWVLKELHKNIAETECKSCNIIEILSNIAVLISLNNIKSINIYTKELPDIKDILFTSNYIEFEELDQFKTIFREDTCVLFNIMCGNIKMSKNLNETFIIVRYLLNSKNKQLYKTKTAIDTIDYIFLLLLKLIKDEKIEEYAMICKDLFYYRIKKKDKYNRINLLFYMIFVMIKHNISEQEIDYKMIKKENSYDYLFVKFNYDKKSSNEITYDKMKYRCDNNKFKDISVHEQSTTDHTRIILE